MSALVYEFGPFRLDADKAVLWRANLSVTVAALRRALGVRDGERSWIQTVPRRGYRFDGPLKGPPGDEVVTLAVLPFAVLGPGAEPHVGLGLADSLISRLTGLEGLRVRPTAAVTHLTGVQMAPREAAEPRFDRLVARVHGRD